MPDSNRDVFVYGKAGVEVRVGDGAVVVSLRHGDLRVGKVSPVGGEFTRGQRVFECLSRRLVERRLVGPRGPAHKYR